MRQTDRQTDMLHVVKSRSSIAERCRYLPKASDNYQRLPKAAEGYRRLPKVKTRQSRLNVRAWGSWARQTDRAPWGGVGVGAVVLFTSESGNEQLSPNQDQT